MLGAFLGSLVSCSAIASSSCEVVIPKSSDSLGRICATLRPSGIVVDTRIRLEPDINNCKAAEPDSLVGNS